MWELPKEGGDCPGHTSRLYKFQKVGLNTDLFLWLLPARDLSTENLLGIYHV